MSTMEDRPCRKPHAVCIPYPAQGHINPMMHLAKLLYHSGFHITFVHTVYNYNRLARSRGAASVAGLPDFRFEAIPDGLPPSSTKDDDVTQDIPSLSDSTSKTCLGPFKALLARLQSQDAAPPPTCIVSDVAMSFTLDAAEELGVPIALLWTASACGLLAYAYYQHLVDRSLVPLKDEKQLTDGYLDTRVDFIPCMEGICLRDLPTFLRTTNPDDPMFNFVVRELRRARRGSAIILNTFEALDHDVLDSLSRIYPNMVLPVGPLHVSLDRIPEESPARAMSSSLWKGNTDCVDWLSSKEEGSVIYVNYGSIAVVSGEQLVEFAWGLANSKRPFLWIIRPDLVAGDGAVLPREFVEGTRGRGLLAGWCDQEEVLSHRSVGGFVTHCGWNSCIESVCGGVPMVFWPFFAEQQTNCWFACGKWGVGMEMDAAVDRGGVERVVREVMEGERGREMRRKAAGWKRLAEEAVGSSGSSTSNFDMLVKQVLLSNKNVQNLQ
uniref:Glycosyltransferase n=1 Tax=Kalanchoe fedtschenkoi TaxID=63787 RepID=A0A7N0TWX6_KALFE